MATTDSLIDFLISIAKEVFSPTGKKESPYDVNYTNHYIELKKFEESCRTGSKKELPINKIVQDNRSKSINVSINTPVDKDQAAKVKEYCETNNIDCNIKQGKLVDITITKNTKGVLEERKWKKDVK